jgi:hypothetical protein
MRIEHFTHERTGTTYKRITKAQAFKLFEQGHTVIIAPVKANMEYIFHLWSIMTYIPNELETPRHAFNRILNSFIYYNCNNELGLYPKFFAPASVCAQYLK